MAVGYVFKLNQEDKKSPPSTVGLVGAFTSSGTRGGGIGGKLYFSENKYQTTFVIAKGRVDVDFYGIGRIPGKEAIKVPIRGGGTVFFGEFLRNVWKIFLWVLVISTARSTHGLMGHKLPEVSRFPRSICRPPR